MANLQYAGIWRYLCLKGEFMTNKTWQNFQGREWIVVSATTSLITGVALHVFVVQTLGSFSVASVILALYVAFWSYVLGSITLIFLSIWVFVMRRVQPETPYRECVELSASIGS